MNREDKFLKFKSLIDFGLLKIILLLLLNFVLFLSLPAQNREELNKKRQQLLAEINEASKLLSVTKKDKKSTKMKKSASSGHWCGIKGYLCGLCGLSVCIHTRSFFVLAGQAWGELPSF